MRRFRWVSELRVSFTNLFSGCAAVDCSDRVEVHASLSRNVTFVGLVIARIRMDHESMGHWSDGSGVSWVTAP